MRQDQDAIAAPKQLTVFNLVIGDEAVLQAQVFDQSAPGFTQALKVATLLGGRAALDPCFTFGPLLEQPINAQAGLGVVDGNRVRLPLTIDQERADAAGQLYVERRRLLASWADGTVLVDKFVLVVPHDEPAIPVEQFIPQSPLFLWPFPSGRDQSHQFRVERLKYLHVAADIVRFHGGENFPQPRVVIPAPAGYLSSLKSNVGFRVDGVNRVHTHLDGIGKRNVHPLLEISPGGEVVA